MEYISIIYPMLESHQFCEGKTEKGKGNQSAGAREGPQAAILSQVIRAGVIRQTMEGKGIRVREGKGTDQGKDPRARVCRVCSSNSKDVMSEDEKGRGKGGWPMQGLRGH